MGIYIHGMQMPESGFTSSIKICWTGEVVMETPAGWKIEAIATPVPDHGRLVDADRLGIRESEKQAYEAYLREKGEDFIEEPLIEYHRGYLEGLTHASGLVRFAPTIIPADKEGEA